MLCSTRTFWRCWPYIKRDESFITVDVSSVSDEEVKYTTDDEGKIQELSKRVPADVAQGEAVGINYVSSKDKKKLLKRLIEVDDQDYFEGAIELTISRTTSSGPPWTSASSTLSRLISRTIWSGQRQHLGRRARAIRNKRTKYPAATFSPLRWHPRLEWQRQYSAPENNSPR